MGLQGSKVGYAFQTPLILDLEKGQIEEWGL
jgi:hypothetical protein